MLAVRRTGRKTGQVTTTMGIVKVIKQTSPVDCGMAALAMALKFHRRHVSLHQLSLEIPVGWRGCTAAELIRAAKLHGLQGAGYRITAADAMTLPKASILHWHNRHFVILDGCTNTRIVILDPSRGRKLCSFDEFARFFSGVAIVFSPVGMSTRGDHATAERRR